jgi:hypothetical protein
MSDLQSAKDINEYVTGYIKIADAKVAGFVTVTTAISGFLLPNLYRWIAEKPIDGWYYLFWTLLVVGSLALLATLLCALNALSPSSDPAESLVSFPDISKMTPIEYKKAYFALSEKDLSFDYLKHNIALSKIAMKKFKWLKLATRSSYLWVTLFGCLYVFYAATAIK